MALPNCALAVELVVGPYKVAWSTAGDRRPRHACE